MIKANADRKESRSARLRRAERISESSPRQEAGEGRETGQARSTFDSTPSGVERAANLDNASDDERSDPISSTAVTSQQAEIADAVSGGSEDAPDPAEVRKSTNELHRSMRGGLGLGTDEDGVHRALEGKSSDEIAAIRAEYQDHYGRSLDEDLESELSGTDLERTRALLSSNAEAAGADALRQAMRGIGTDEAALVETLQGRTPEQLEAIKTQYQERHGRSLEDDLASELSGRAYDQVSSLLRGDGAGADVAVLRNATEGLGTDESTVFGILESRTPAQKTILEETFQRETGRSLNSVLENEMSGHDFSRAESALAGDVAANDVARLRQASDRLGTDEAQIFEVLDGATEQERTAIAREYREQTGQDLESMLSREMGGSDLEQASTLLERGEISDAQRLRFATDGLGTDEESIQETLAGKSREEIEEIRAEFSASYGRDLDQVLGRELSGRDAFETGLALEGAPEDGLGELEVANRRRNFERAGLGRAAMDLVTGHGRTLDGNTTRANQYAAEALSDGTLSDVESARLEQLAGYVNDDVETYQEAKDSISEGAATVAGTAASVGVVVASAGTAAPLASTVLGAAAAGAGARVGTNTMLQGPSYGSEAVMTDAVLGAVEGATAIVGAGAGTAAGRTLIERQARNALLRSGVEEPSTRMVQLASRELLARNESSRALAGVVSGAADGAVGGGLVGGAEAALNDGTWDDGLAEGLTRVARGTAVGAGTGAAAGAVVGGSRAADHSLEHLLNESEARVPSVNAYGSESWRQGTYEEQLAVSRALDPNPRQVVLSSPYDSSFEQTVKVFGATSQSEVDNMTAALDRLSELDAHQALIVTREVHILDHLGGSSDTTIGGLGGDGREGTIMLSRAFARRPEGQNVVHHEVAHSIDARSGWFTRGGNARHADHPFGQGESVSAYGATNATEDFAETHEDFIRNWEQIVADPDRYFEGEVGAKRRWIYDNLYPDMMEEN